MSLKNFVVLIALGGQADVIQRTVSQAHAEGVACHLIVDSRHEEAIKQALASVDQGRSVELTTIRTRRMQWARNRVNKFGSSLVAFVSDLIYRSFRFVAHRSPIEEASAKQIQRAGEKTASITTWLGNGVLNRLVDPAVMAVGTTGTKPLEVRSVVAAASNRIESDLVIGVVCLDATSLLPGLVLSKTHRGMPVLTTYPPDWDVHAAEARRRMSGGEF